MSGRSGGLEWGEVGEAGEGGAVLCELGLYGAPCLWQRAEPESDLISRATPWHVKP